MKQVCTLIVLACLSWHVRAQYSFKGTVTGTDNTPLIGAHVVLDSRQRIATNENGSFVFQNISPGNYRVTVSYIGYTTYESVFRLVRDTVMNIILKESVTLSDAVVVAGVRATENTPATFTTMNKEDIEQRNQVQDLPYILEMEPSVVTTSDAGTGVGYTGLRIRGSDITRINVTINGIPLNDPESHAVYWVDIPDMAGSINSIQIQRGVGSSTNGAGAFGASMNMETNDLNDKPYGSVSMAGGSFNTWKTSFRAGTGMINDHWNFEGRASALGSDGYIDRASSQLKSYFIQGGYYDEKNLLKAVMFGGREKTYQAWYGIDRETMEQKRTFNWAGAILNDDRSIRYYDDQSDNYTQNHYQLHYSRVINSSVNLNLSGHYTRGLGYYEEYNQDELFADYGLKDLYFGRDSIFDGSKWNYFYEDTIRETDLVRTRWLDNHYYGLTWAFQYKRARTDFILGGAVNWFDNAKHYGKLAWMEIASDVPKDYKYYENTSFKNDFNLYAKIAWDPSENMTLYADMQYRTLVYRVKGIESHQNLLDIDENFNFLNPKAGITYRLNLGTVYASYSVAHREPIRDDFTDALEGEKPKPELMGDLELGIRKYGSRFSYSLNYYLMNYRDQLVLTGQINDDGQYIRRNAGQSYRMGIEAFSGYSLAGIGRLSVNLTISRNRTDYTQEVEENLVEFKNTPISFSPSVIGGLTAHLTPVRNFEVDWTLKYVGKQYLDNTGNDDLALDPYTVNSLRTAFKKDMEKFPQFEVFLLINNLFNAEYESNGAVWGNTPYYYPQAGIHFLAGVNIVF